MSVKIEGLSPDGRRVPLKLEGGTLTSLCMEVSRAACVIVVAPARCRMEARSAEIQLTDLGYRRIRLELLPDPPKPPKPPPWLRGEPPPLECHRCGSAVEPGAQLEPCPSADPDAPAAVWCPACAEAEVRWQNRRGCQECAANVLRWAVAELGRSTTPEGRLPILASAAWHIGQEVERINRGG